MEKLVERFKQKDRLALSKLITLVENNSPQTMDIMGAIYSPMSKAYVLGVTGPPGAGKSTLVDKLIRAFRQAGHTVGVLCVDPSSIFSGGAFLGDRVRMPWAYRDDGVYLRSLATRGALGGLAPRISEIIEILAAFGIDIIIVETVGVGQLESDIIRYSDTKIVVSVPGLGDQMQALKAGILEIADIFVVNKADLPGAQNVVDDLQVMLHLRKAGERTPQVILTEALGDRGISELFQAVQRHKDYLAATGLREFQLKRRREETCHYAIQEILKKLVEKSVEEVEEINQVIRIVREGGINPYKAAENITQLVFDKHIDGR